VAPGATVKRHATADPAGPVTEEPVPPPIAAMNTRLEGVNHHLWCLSSFLQVFTFPPRVQIGNEPPREHPGALDTAVSMLADCEAVVW